MPDIRVILPNFAAKMKMRVLCLLLVFLTSLTLKAQSTDETRAVLYGNVTDQTTKQPVIGAVVLIKGTSFGAATDFEGNYRIEGLKGGDYTVEVRYLGYETLIREVPLAAGTTQKADFVISQAVLGGETVIIEGRRPVVDVEESSSTSTLRRDVIQAQPARDIQQIISTQPGVNQSPTGLHIRGSRTYETGFYIDDVSAKDPLAGTGFGVDIGSNALQEVQVTTGGAGVQYGNNTAGVVSTTTRTGGKSYEGGILYKRDNFGFNKNWNSVWNQQLMEFNFGGAYPFSLRLRQALYVFHLAPLQSERYLSGTCSRPAP